MKSRCYIWIALALGLIAFVILIFRHRFDEPRYEGKRISQWLEEANSWDNFNMTPGARVILKQLGSNAVPPLLKKLSEGESLWCKLLLRASGKSIPAPIRGFAARQLERKYLHIQRASIALQVIGPQASAAVPQLEQAVCDPDTHLGWYPAAAVLGSIEMQGLLALERSLTNAPVIRQAAIQSFIRSACLDNLRSGDLALRHKSALYFSDQTPAPLDVVSVLVDMIDTRKPEQTEIALKALGRLFPQYLTARDALRDAAKHDDKRIKEMANDILEANLKTNSLTPP